MSIKMIKGGVLAAATAVLVLASASMASANLEVTRVGTSLSTPDGTMSRQAGAHPDFNVHMDFASTDQGGVLVPNEAVRDVDVALPPGLTGNPTVASTCSQAQLYNLNQGLDACPANSQVGVVRVHSAFYGDIVAGLQNLDHGPDAPALFGFNIQGSLGIIRARVRPGDYGISSASLNISQAQGFTSISVTLWGVPADPVHDAERGLPLRAPLQSTEEPLPFMTNPTSCSDTPSAFTVSADSWENTGAFSTNTFTADDNGIPFTFDGCDQLPFAPAITVQPLSHTADSPTGLDIDLDVPQNDSPSGLATAQVRSTVVKLPEGMSVSPSSAAGLGACAPSDIALGSSAAPTCPSSSKLGTVRIDTPLLDVPLTGDVILAKQNDNPFHSLLALYLVAQGPGVVIKLPGRVDPDPVTGQLTASFDNTPQLPFSHLSVNFRGGSRASLATPAACGTYSTSVDVASWASSAPVHLTTPMTIDSGCSPPEFHPSFSAGSTRPFAGQDSPFTFSLTRSDGTPLLSRINTTLPAGLLANIGSAVQCDPVSANAGTCPASSRIGTTSVLSGPGADPLALSGNVYLTGPYHNSATGQNAPFGMSIVVQTAGQAGPFDLGLVVVRAGIYVDRTDAHVSVVSDPLPTIIDGFPLRLRQVQLAVDRPNFMFNPTSCKQKSIFGAFAAVGGATSDQSAAFQLGGCGDLSLKQKLALSFTGANSMKVGAYPGVEAKMTSASGGANLSNVQVKLPLSVALEPDHANALCEPEQRARLACPKQSIIGSARLVSVLPDPLTGPVYFVHGTRKSPSGRTINTLPKLWIPLSADGVTIDLNADSDVDSINRLVTTFHDIPDAPFSSFDLKINGGKHGILVVTGTNKGICDRDTTVDVQLTGQNGSVVRQGPKAGTACRPKVSKATLKEDGRLVVRVANVGGGTVTLSGTSIARASRKLKSATAASLTTRLQSGARKTLARHGKVPVTLSIRYLATGARKAIAVKQKVMVRR